MLDDFEFYFWPSWQVLHCKAYFYPKRDIYKGNSEHLLFLSSSLLLFTVLKPTEESGVFRTDTVEKAKKMFQFCLPNYLMCDYLENHCLPADGRLAGKVISQAVPGCYKRRTLILVHACLLCLMTSWMPLSNSYMTMSWKLKSAFQFSAYCALGSYSWFKIIPLQSAYLKFFVTFSGAQNFSTGVF